MECLSPDQKNRIFRALISSLAICTLDSRSLALWGAGMSSVNVDVNRLTSQVMVSRHTKRNDFPERDSCLPIDTLRHCGAEKEETQLSCRPQCESVPFSYLWSGAGWIVLQCGQKHSSSCVVCAHHPFLHMIQTTRAVPRTVPEKHICQHCTILTQWPGPLPAGWILCHCQPVVLVVFQVL